MNLKTNLQKQFTTIGKGHGAPCKSATREEWETLRREPWLAQTCARIEEGEEELKHHLPVWTPHCAEFKDNHRANADALKRLSRLMLDFDEKNHTDDIMAQLKAKSENLKAAGIEVLLIEESVRRGTHVLVEKPESITAEQVQELMKEFTGFAPDPSVKDFSRCIYMVPEDHTRYVSEKLFEASPLPTPVREGDGSTGETPLPQLGEVGKGLTFKGIPYSSIIKEYWSRTGGEPSEGERNVKLHKLAANLRSICDNKKDVLLAIMPRYGLNETEMMSIIDHACKEQPTGISKTMADITEHLSLNIENIDEDLDSKAENSQSQKYKLHVNKLPIGLKESLSGVPKTMYMPVLCGIMPIAGTYADQVEVQYCDGNMQHLGLMSIIYGDQASNKSVVKNAVVVWKRKLDEEDALARMEEDKWKERKKNRRANENGPEDPKALIRQTPLTVSNSTLLRRMKNAKGHTIYSFGEELDTLRKTNGAGSWSAKYDVYRLAFDRGEWGQDYNSDAAESGVVNAAYNWTVLGTKGALNKCFKGDNVENGLSSRILVSEMPDGSFAKMPKFGRRSVEEEANINEAVKRLQGFSGFIDTPRLRKGIEEWVEEKRIEAAKDIDYVKDIYRKRSAVIGFRCGVIFHLLSGCAKESKACVEFAVMMAEYCLEQQMKAFGDILRNEYVSAKQECQRYGVNHSIFDQMPEVFTMDDLRAKKGGFCGESALRNIIARWKKEEWIEKVDSRHWKKCQTPQCHNATLSH